jgi:hypothetical protein
MKFAVVMTTIRVPTVLSEYVKLAPEDTRFYVVGDHKTPHDSVRAYLGGLQLGERIIYIDPKDIAGTHPRILHWNENHDSLRVAAFLRAASSADVIITVDDDNAPQSDFFEVYERIFGAEQTVLAQEGWVNNLTSAGFKPLIYPRGFPYAERVYSGGITKQVKGRTVFHQGLTLGDPDIDALTRFNMQPATDTLSSTIRGVAGWTCVNTQNSAIAAPYAKYWWAPKWCGRHWDIVAGLIVQWTVFGSGLVTYGGPFTVSVRNEHDEMKDILNEATGADLVEKLSWQLTAPFVAAKDPAARYAALAERLLGSRNRLVYHLGEAMMMWQEEIK